MPEKKQIKRDFPLSPTSAPQAIDNTYVKKPIVNNIPNVEYKYITGVKKFGDKPTSKDSADYKEGYKIGLSGEEVSNFATLAKYAGKMEGKEKRKKYK
jgi:hypothetical protein